MAQWTEYQDGGTDCISSCWKEKEMCYCSQGIAGERLGTSHQRPIVVIDAD